MTIDNGFDTKHLAERTRSAHRAHDYGVIACFEAIERRNQRIAELRKKLEEPTSAK